MSSTDANVEEILAKLSVPNKIKLLAGRVSIIDLYI